MLDILTGDICCSCFARLGHYHSTLPSLLAHQPHYGHFLPQTQVQGSTLLGRNPPNPARLDFCAATVFVSVSYPHLQPTTIARTFKAIWKDQAYMWLAPKSQNYQHVLPQRSQPIRCRESNVSTPTPSPPTQIDPPHQNVLPRHSPKEKKQQFRTNSYTSPSPSSDKAKKAKHTNCSAVKPHFDPHNSPSVVQNWAQHNAPDGAQQHVLSTRR